MSQSSIAGMQIRTKGLWCPRGNEVPGYWDGQRRFQGWYKFCLFLKGRYKLNRLKMNQRRTWLQISGVWIHVKRIMNRNILCKSFTYYKLKICLRVKVVTFQSFFFFNLLHSWWSSPWFFPWVSFSLLLLCIHTHVVMFDMSGIRYVSWLDLWILIHKTLKEKNKIPGSNIALRKKVIVDII